MRSWISLSLLLLAAASVAVAQQPAPAASPAAQATTQASPAPSASDKDEPQIEVPAPVGAPIRGVKIPHYGADGKLQMLFVADQAMKTDEDHVEFENLTIEAYNTDGSKFDVRLPKSVLDMKTRVLKGDSRVFIDRDDFQIEGDAVEFFTKTRFGKITGNVKMTIYNSDKFTP